LTAKWARHQSGARFDCKLVLGEGGEVVMHQSWSEDRLQQFKDVHKSPALELVGWFTIAPTSGPQPHHLPIHQQILHTYNESAVLLAFHPSVLLTMQQPVENYLSPSTSVFEGESPAGQAGGDGDKAMQMEGQEAP
jgi:COP9 signalosome complex subunit 6